MMRLFFFFISLIQYHFLESSYSLPHLPFYSQNGEDRYVYEKFFKDKKEGFFVEIGAHDGVSYSNTAYFEKILNWKGICFEPHPEKFKELIKNRSCILLNKAVTNSGGILDFMQINGAPEMLSGLIDNYDPQHLKRIDLELARDGGSAQIIQVDGIRLQDALCFHNIDFIDLLSIDTEGNEYQILTSIDLKKIFIDVVIVENNYNDPKINLYMRKNFYKLVKTIDGNQIYKNKRSL